MRKVRNFTLAAAILVFATGVSFAGTASAQPMPPGMGGAPMPPMPDLHVRIVTEAPPPRRHEVVVVSPGPHQTYIKGYWHHSGEAWAWSDGRWSEPPRKHAHWIKANYKKVKGGTRYTPGHWSYEKVIYN